MLRSEGGAAAGDDGGDAATDAPIPATASPYDALPEAVRLAMDKPFTDDFDAHGQASRDSRGRDLQPHALLHRQGAGARADVRGR